MFDETIPLLIGFLDFLLQNLPYLDNWGYLLSGIAFCPELFLLLFIPFLEIFWFVLRPFIFKFFEGFFFDAGVSSHGGQHWDQAVVVDVAGRSLLNNRVRIHVLCFLLVQRNLRQVLLMEHGSALSRHIGYPLSIGKLIDPVVNRVGFCFWV